MRCGSALLLASMMVLTPLASDAAPLRPILGPDGKPLVITAQVPTAAGVGLSFAMPGGGQFYLGETTKGWTYVGSTVLGAGLAAGLQHFLFFNVLSQSTYVSPEQLAMETVLGIAYSWIGVGIVSALDAHHSISERQPALKAAP